MSKDKTDSSRSSTTSEESSKNKEGGSIPQVASGQFLEGFTEQEWEKGASAKPAEMLKVEKTPNTVSVFVGPKETVEKIVVQKPTSKENQSKENAEKEKNDPLAQLVNRVARLITNERDDDQTEVKVTITVRPKQRKPTKQIEK